MHHTPRWTGILIGIVAVVLLALPLLLLVFRTPQVTTLMPSFVRSKTVPSARYSVQNDKAGYDLALADTAYLDYVTANLNIFAPDALVDPRLYTGKLHDTKRLSVTRIRFDLVDQVGYPIGTIVQGDGDTTPNIVTATGDYTVQGDLLIVRVAVQFGAFDRSGLTQKFAWEDAFLHCAVNTMYYALGDPDPQANQRVLAKTKQDMDYYLLNGIFPWPFRITEARS